MSCGAGCAVLSLATAFFCKRALRLHLSGKAYETTVMFVLRRTVADANYLVGTVRFIAVIARVSPPRHNALLDCS
jgi:hypothetical protein